MEMRHTYCICQLLFTPATVRVETRFRIVLNTQKLPVRHPTTRGPEQTARSSVDSVVRFDFSFSFHIKEWIKQEFKYNIK